MPANLWSEPKNLARTQRNKETSPPRARLILTHGLQKRTTTQTSKPQKPGGDTATGAPNHLMVIKEKWQTFCRVVGFFSFFFSFLSFPLSSFLFFVSFSPIDLCLSCVCGVIDTTCNIYVVVLLGGGNRNIWFLQAWVVRRMHRPGPGTSSTDSRLHFICFWWRHELRQLWYMRVPPWVVCVFPCSLGYSSAPEWLEPVPVLWPRTWLLIMWEQEQQQQKGWDRIFGSA